MFLKKGMYVSCNIRGHEISKALVGEVDGTVVLFFDCNEMDDKFRSNYVDPDNGYEFMYKMSLHMSDLNTAKYKGYVTNIILCGENPNLHMVD